MPVFLNWKRYIDRYSESMWSVQYFATPFKNTYLYFENTICKMKISFRSNFFVKAVAIDFIFAKLLQFVLTLEAILHDGMQASIEFRRFIISSYQI